MPLLIICVQIIIKRIWQMLPKQHSCPSYKQFCERLKTKNKKQKAQRKQYLRQISQRKMVESSEGSNDQQCIKKTYKKGNKWWTRINRKYFQEIDVSSFENMRQFTTSENIIDFGEQICPFYPYYQEIIYSEEPFIFQDDSIRVVYRLSNKATQKDLHLLAGYAWNPFPEQAQPGEQISYITERLPNFYSFHSPEFHPLKHQEEEQISAKKQKGEIKLISFTDDEDFIVRCLQYERLWRDQKTSELQKEIQCWRNQLQRQHEINVSFWDRVEDQVYREKKLYNHQDYSVKIQEIKRFLIRSEIFSYFRMGYADKTVDEYQKALGYIKQNQAEQLRQKQQKKVGKQHHVSNFFQTDCKICFCTKNEPTNKVIYCDNCNTSFHQSCYSIQNIEEDKQIICDVCLYIRKMQSQQKGSSFEQPTCQICGRGKFPIKNIDEHYYHVSCLILFDFAHINQFTIDLKPGITHKSIMNAVIDNELQYENCQFCVKNNYLGMQFRCTYEGCKKFFHPICAYLNGCVFNISRNKEGGVHAKVQCRSHIKDGFGDLVSQVYLRRFMCNYKNTAKIKQEQFKEEYKKELEKKVNHPKTSLTQNEGGIQRILKVKVPIGANQQQKSKQDSLKKCQSNISGTSNNSNSKNVKQITKPKKMPSTSKQKMLKQD